MQSSRKKERSLECAIIQREGKERHETRRELPDR